MDNLVIAATLALSNRKRFVVHTQSPTQTELELNKVLESWGMRCCSVDVNQDASDILQQMLVDGQLCPVVFWREVHKCLFVQQRSLVLLLDQLDQFDTNTSKINGLQTIKVQNLLVRLPSFYTIIAVLPVVPRVKLYKNLKEKFWFSHFHDGQTNLGLHFDDYPQKLVDLNRLTLQVHQLHEITIYIYSLIVQIRNHRLLVLGLIQSRLHTDTMDKVLLLARALAAWHAKPHLYVTPEHCQAAMRKIGYWLVDWEVANGLFDFDQPETEILENQRKLVVNMLAGEWYGSEWDYVKRYLQENRGKYDTTSNTGYLNSIVEESIELVKPPV